MNLRWLAPLALVIACGDNQVPPGAPGQVVEGACQITGVAPAELSTITCRADYDALASVPIDGSLPGARSVKLIIDHADGDRVHFQNTVAFGSHYEFAVAHLSGHGLPVVALDAGEFYGENDYASGGRFLLAELTYYEGPKRFTIDLAPYNVADSATIASAYDVVRRAVYFGDELAFHPTSDALAGRVPPGVPVVTTDELYAGIDYQPLSLGSAIGRLHFTTAAALATEYVSYQDIVVLDDVPNDISVVQGIITQAFQTPLSHVNVLSRNRHTPNMALRGATTLPALTALDGQLVELAVTAEAWTIRSVSQAEASQWWADHAPAPVTLPARDVSLQPLTDIVEVAPEAPGVPLRDAIQAGVHTFGGKASHYGVLYRTPGVPIRDAFAIPDYFYDQFMKTNGFYDRVTALLADPSFTTDPAVRDAQLARLRADMLVAPVDPALSTQLQAKVAARFAGVPKLRFRSSSNSEDLAGFPCAGCYDSKSGKASKLDDMLDAIRDVYASAWAFRAFELRSYFGVDHFSVGMGVLVHQSFPDEEANGVAVTANPFVPGGIDLFYVNVQQGDDVEVVAPPPGVTSDELLYYYFDPARPIEYVQHSSLIPTGSTVLTTAQLLQLGDALAAIRTRFDAAYGLASGNPGWYA
ncbi:MAG TPA: PEP/pyruvate-binding domain-containing protein, partial [Kofleriaceae bacterium]